MATMVSVMSGSAAVVVATGRDPAAFPRLVRAKARAAPELAEVIDDLSVIEKHRGVGMLAWSPWMG